jgi:SHS2 domain-containing protein
VSEAVQRRGFVELEHTADRAVEAWGATLPELFVAAAEAMFSVSEELSKIERLQEWSLELEAETPEDLLRAWLAELLWVSERDLAIPCAFGVGELDETRWRLRAKAWGGPAPRETPHTGAPVKAVTYHELRVWMKDGVWRAHVVFDV